MNNYEEEDYQLYYTHLAQQLNVVLHSNEENYQLHFSYMGGAGTISCNDCGYKEDIVSFVHSFNANGNPSDGRSGHQCQSCGKFHTVEIEMAVKPYICSCGGELSRDKVLFCPQCKSTNMEYSCRYIT